MDRIAGEQAMLHGKFVVVGDGTPRWLPVGGVKAAKPSKELANEITRVLPPVEGPADDIALVYTTTGDVLPGRVGSIDGKRVDLESPIVEMTSLTVEYLDAIQFGSTVRQDITGFNDPSWRVVKGAESKIAREGGRVTMQPDSAIWNPGAMLSSEISFKITSTGFSAVRLRMFCPRMDGAKSVNLAFLLGINDGMRIGFETDGQFEQECMDVPLASFRTVTIRISIQPKELGIYVNGGFQGYLHLDPSRRPGAGLIIEPFSMWGNTVQPIELADFSSKAEAGLTWVPSVDGKTKARLLTVPRFRKEDSPRNALIATNGDVLRGEIVSATATHFGFRSGLEMLRIPRDRVNAAIWLKQPEVNRAPSEPRNPTREKLKEKLGETIRYNAPAEMAIQFVLQRAGDLKFKMPDKYERQSYLFRLGSQMAIGEALDEICAMAGMNYRVADDGLIVFELPLQKTPNIFSQRVFVLRKATLSSDGSALKFFADKGVSFPQGASVGWVPESKQLTVSNTIENLEKVARIIDADLGGTLATPTHWLILSNGGRIALEVEKFAEDAIIGKHPIYGACKIAMKDVYKIRTSPPEPSPAMISLADWHLVNAPEPVIAESGGDSSPMLGKEAKTFSLKTLKGEEFDLAKEKGKVVVLDFWATWCGPCVKSLPGLIEAMAPFPADKVKFVGLNQGEAPEHVKEFLETRGWKLDVGLDANQSVARQYGVEGIPHTVVIGPDGKIILVKSGYSPGADTEIANAVTQLLSGGASSASKEPAPVQTVR
jgi:thiol-disulfide isomerase/thioredoxin